MAEQCAIRLPLEFCIFAKRQFYRKEKHINQVTTVLRRSEVFLANSLLFGKIELDTHTHTTTVTLGACAPRVNENLHFTISSTF